MDSDLQHLIEHSAPPLQLANLSTFRSLLFKKGLVAGYEECRAIFRGMIFIYIFRH